MRPRLAARYSDAATTAAIGSPGAHGVAGEDRPIGGVKVGVPRLGPDRFDAPGEIGGGHDGGHPRAARAAATSILAIRAWAKGLRTKAT